MPTDSPDAPILWFAEPAAAWHEASPLGNGRLGAMVPGGWPLERIGLNEDTFWSGPGDVAVPDVPAGLLEEVRGLLREGRHRAAGEALRATQGADAEALQPVGDLEIEHLGPGGADTGYRRELDLRDGTATVERAGGGFTVRREVLVSAVHQVVAVRLETDDPRGLRVRLRFSTPQARAETRPEGSDGLALLLAAPRHVVPSPRPEGVVLEDDARRSIRAAALLTVRAEGAAAAVVRDEGPHGPALTVRGAGALTAYVAVRTGFDGWDRPPARDAEQCLSQAAEDVRAALAAGWEGVRSAHTAEHRNLMDRVTLSFETPGPVPDLPLDARLTRRADGAADEGLCALAFAFGRYLLAASSRPGSEPATLQGVWNGAVEPPWNCDYTVNINTEMNYWPAESTALAECHEPLLDLVRDLAVAGRESARRIYGARGWTCHHNTDLWRLSVPVGKGLGDPSWSSWPMGGAWLCTHLAERWRFGRDLGFLAADALPVALDAARFVLDLLVPDAEGRLVTSPSTSPENEFATGGGPAGVDVGGAMDLTLARELFGFVLEARHALDAAGIRPRPADADTLDEVRGALARLAPLRVGSRGQLLEWSAEYGEVDPHHRHVSHLVGLYPGRVLAADPRLRAAARRSLEERGDEGTGWSVAWKIGLWARLGDGAAAHRLLERYLRPAGWVSPDGRVNGGGVYRSLLCAHPPFQIDGNFGVTAAIAEMLVQSHAEGGAGPVVELLPALPPQWPAGTVRGLRARGAVTVEELVWRDGAAVSAVLKASADTRVELRWRDRAGARRTRPLVLRAGQTATLD